MKTKLSLILLLITLISGCAPNSTAIAEAEYLDKILVLKKLPEISMSDPAKMRQEAKLVAAKLEIVLALSPPPKYVAYHNQLIKTLRLYDEAYQLFYESQNRNAGGQKIEAIKKSFDAKIEHDILNYWFPEKDARVVNGDQYFDLINQIFIVEQQPANEAFNQYVAGDGATNDGIMAKLAENKNLLEKEKNKLLKIKPPASLIDLHYDFLRVFLMDERANSLYTDALNAANQTAIESLTGLSNDYSERSSELLSESLEELSAKTRHRNRWEIN